MAKYAPKLSDLGNPENLMNIKEEVIDNPDSDLEVARIKSNYNQSMNQRRKEIQDKIDHLNNKLKKHELKEGMLDMIIAQTYTELENLKENEFSKRGQKQSVLIKQLEALSILHDTILKYEDMIQKYHKILMDIENNKLNSYLKIEGLKKEETTADDNLQEVLQELQQIFKGGGASISANPLMDEIQQELKDSNY